MGHTHVRKEIGLGVSMEIRMNRSHFLCGAVINKRIHLMSCCFSKDSSSWGCALFLSQSCVGLSCRKTPWQTCFLSLSHTRAWKVPAWKEKETETSIFPYERERAINEGFPMLPCHVPLPLPRDYV